MLLLSLFRKGLSVTNYLLNFCFFSNPLFIIGTIGILLLGNKKLGILILISHYLSNFIIAIVTRKKKNNKEIINIRYGFYKMKEKINKSKPFAIDNKTFSAFKQYINA